MEQHFEAAHELVTMLDEGHDKKLWNLDDPIYAETPHGTYFFIITGIEEQIKEGENRIVLKLREVAR
jgi:hypothetical protein